MPFAIPRNITTTARRPAGGETACSERRERESDSRPCYGFPLATHAPPPHFRFEGVVTTLVPFFGVTTGGVGFAAPTVRPGVTLPIELPVTLPPAEVGLFTPPTAAGFVTVGADVVAPPIAGAGFEAPPITFCFVLAGPPTAFWASEGWETAVVNTPSDVTRNVTLNIALHFMTQPFVPSGDRQYLR